MSGQPFGPKHYTTLGEFEGAGIICYAWICSSHGHEIQGEMYTYCEMHIRDQNQSLNLFLAAQFIVYTKVPIWVGSSKTGVLKGWVGLGTCILKRVCSKGVTKEQMHTTISLFSFVPKCWHEVSNWTSLFDSTCPLSPSLSVSLKLYYAWVDLIYLQGSPQSRIRCSTQQTSCMCAQALTM